MCLLVRTQVILTCKAYPCALYAFNSTQKETYNSILNVPLSEDIGKPVKPVSEPL